MYEKVCDIELIDLITKGNKAAIVHLLVDRCGTRLKFLTKFKFKMLNLRLDEVVSEVYLHLKKNNWRALSNFRGQNENGRPCSLENYISLIASRLLWKKMNKAMKEFDLFSPLINKKSESIYPENRLNDSIDYKVELLLMIEKLENPMERLVLMFYKIEGFPASEVATELNLSEANVYTICHRAIKRLRAMVIQKKE